MTDGDEGTAGTDSAASPDIGTVAEEAAKLFGALNGWVGQAGAGRSGAAAQGLADGLRSVGEQVGHDDDCRYCPVCQGIRVIRETSPEVREHLATAIGSLAQAATAALRQPGASAGEQAPRGPDKVDLDE